MVYCLQQTMNVKLHAFPCHGLTDETPFDLDGNIKVSLSLHGNEKHVSTITFIHSHTLYGLYTYVYTR